ncbi:unnamed protein product [Polarella glacialis]|uniref:Uncharacterized protein n=1 Tax=Polarella glacialis TaxID=89957 RepID=A0A813GZF0_POLGL|nr:unnamed protein product [Polarella glacialis]
MLANLTRPWILLTGDSNWRKVFKLLTEQLANETQAVRYAHETMPKSTWDARWFDDDAVFDTKSGRHFRVSLRFMWNSTKRLELWNSDGNSIVWTNQILLCGHKDPRLAALFSCVQHRHPDFSDEIWSSGPHALVFAHGLWSLPHNRSCEETGPLLKSLITRAGGQAPKIVRWASNFLISAHPVITNRDIEHDRACQRSQAQTLKLPFMDLGTYVRARVDVGNGDFHMKEHAARRVIKALLKDIAPECFG